MFFLIVIFTNPSIFEQENKILFYKIYLKMLEIRYKASRQSLILDKFLSSFVWVWLSNQQLGSLSLIFRVL